MLSPEPITSTVSGFPITWALAAVLRYVGLVGKGSSAELSAAETSISARRAVLISYST